MIQEKKLKKSDKNVIMKNDVPSMQEKRAFIGLLTTIAKRVSQENQDDAKSR